MPPGLAGVEEKVDAEVTMGNHLKDGLGVNDARIYNELAFLAVLDLRVS
jgi:hypothetical protein